MHIVWKYQYETYFDLSKKKQKTKKIKQKKHAFKILLFGDFYFTETA